ncbi:MAG TPA: phosphoketolase family protein [Rhodocyclaceae bacterium]|nr:phosphoketolase family protein [Rhodocyclaceae bacterium]
MKSANPPLEQIHALWRASNYLGAAMIYLRDNPLLREPLKIEHIKQRLLGHWGSSPGLSFCYLHLARLVKELDLNAIFITGPGHGAPGVLAPVWLEGTYGEVYPDKCADKNGIEGLRRFLRDFSFPGGIGSHCTPELPGSIHEGGELGYSLSHAFGAAFDNPDLIVAAVVGDGEAETGPLATSWHGNKFLNPVRDGAVLPILHLNGYKINNPTLLARISHEELRALFEGYGWTPIFVEGHEPMDMHAKMATAMSECIDEIRSIQQRARKEGELRRPRWPMIVLRSPKGWTGPAEVDGHKVEDFWRSHQVPLAGLRENSAHLVQLEAWLRSYAPEALFDAQGVLRPELRALLPAGERRMSANPHANTGIVKRLDLPDERAQAVAVPAPGGARVGNTRPLGRFLAEVMRANPDNFRVFSPDENSSNKLDALYAVSGKTWMADVYPEDADGTHLAQDGKVMEMLSEHTLEGWLEGYLLTGRHGFLSTYESFAHVIDSMYNQHAKWLAMANEVAWRKPIASLNLLITSTVWRQDHNGFTHQDPGFLDVAINKDPEVTRIYLPPDANCLLVTAAHCLRSKHHINVIVADKQEHLQYLDYDAAVAHCRAGAGIWSWASNDEGGEPDAVVACAGDVPTQEALAAVEMLRRHVPTLRLRFVNVMNLFAMAPKSEHPQGWSDADFDRLFTRDKPVIFNFHGYPYLIHRLAYRRANHANIHVRGYMEQGSIDTPLVLAMRNRIDRFGIAMDVLRYVPDLAKSHAHVVTLLKAEQQACHEYALEHGVDKPEISAWGWGLDRA